MVRQLYGGKTIVKRPYRHQFQEREICYISISYPDMKEKTTSDSWRR